MRTLILLAISAGLAVAQQSEEPMKLAQEQAKAKQAQRQAEIQALKAEEAARQAKLEQLRARYNDNYPDVRTAKEELSRAEAALNKLKQAEAANQSLQDRWWRNAGTAQAVGLTADQQKTMDDVFQQYRLRLVELNAALEREEITLEPMLSATPLDDAKIKAQIDRVAEARANLEKAKGRMLLAIREQLNPEQWNKLSQNYSLTPGGK